MKNEKLDNVTSCANRMCTGITNSMDETLKKELNQFLGKAALAAYAGHGKEAEPQRLGFTEFEFQEGRFSY